MQARRLSFIDGSSEYSHPKVGIEVTDVGSNVRQTALVKVFLVEDSPLLRERVSGIIASIPGAQNVGHAAGADEAIAAIERERPDVVVVDIHLEQGNGFDVLQALRTKGSQVHAFVLTNFANDAYRRKAERLGAHAVFDKSTEFERLREALVGIVRRP